jgi:hypothetical protein
MQLATAAIKIEACKKVLTLKILSKLGGTTAGESVGVILVNSSLKLLVSSSLVNFGMKGAGIALVDNRSQSMPCGNTKEKSQFFHG